MKKRTVYIITGTALALGAVFCIVKLAMMLFFPLLRKAFSTLKIFYIGVIAAIAGYLILLGLSIAGTKNVYGSL